jgi:hypothetical protein
MRLYFRVGLTYSGAFKATGIIIAVVLITSLTVYVSWECLKSLDDRGFMKELQKLNLSIAGSGKQYENTGKTRRSSRAPGVAIRQF